MWADETWRCPRRARQNAELRELDATVPFEIRMMEGEIYHCTRITMATWKRIAGYTDMGIVQEWGAMKMYEAHPKVQMSNDMCEQFVDLLSATALEHIKRAMAFTHGPPKRMSLLQSVTPGSPEKLLQELKKDLELFEGLKAAPAFPGQDVLIKRSPFNTVAVKHLVACCQQEGWKPTPKFLSLFPARQNVASTSSDAFSGYFLHPLC